MSSLELGMSLLAKVSTGQKLKLCENNIQLSEVTPTQDILLLSSPFWASGRCISDTS
jgi:hypothetical protein